MIPTLHPDVFLDEVLRKNLLLYYSYDRLLRLSASLFFMFYFI